MEVTVVVILIISTVHEIITGVSDQSSLSYTQMFK